MPKVASAINSEMIILYWNIGKIIKNEILKNERAEYGKTIIKSLSRELTNSYGKGYSQANLFNMVRQYNLISPINITSQITV